MRYHLMVNKVEYNTRQCRRATKKAIAHQRL